jgi:hypothetical protein
MNRKEQIELLKKNLCQFGSFRDEFPYVFRSVGIQNTVILNEFGLWEDSISKEPLYFQEKKIYRIKEDYVEKEEEKLSYIVLDNCNWKEVFKDENFVIYKKIIGYKV